MEQCFRFYTWQLPDWDITKENRDSFKSAMRWGDYWVNLEPLYKKLEQKLKTLDFVWCFSIYEHWGDSDINKLWELDVPSSKIFYFLDSEIWNTMLEAVNSNKQSEYPCWDKLIIKKSEGIKRLSNGKNNITPLLRVPLCTSIKVLDSSKFNKGPVNLKAKYEDLPSSLCEAKKYRNESKFRVCES